MEKIIEILEGPNGTWIAAFSLAAAALLGGAIFYRVAVLLSRIRISAKARRGRRMEGAAKKLLEENGFTVLGEQVPQHVAVLVDGERSETTLHADFIVKKGRRLFVADSKTGADAASPPAARVRRQLLEYCLAYECDSSLLVDMDSRTISEVEFDLPLQRGISPGGALILSLFSLLLGALAAAWL